MSAINVDEWMEKLRVLADAAGKKTGEMVELSKCKMETVRISGEIKRLQEKLGMEIYRLVKTNQSNSQSVEMLTQQIDAQFAQLDEMERAIIALQNKRLCTSCGTVNPKNAVYCLKCGEKFAAEEEKTEPCCDSEMNCSCGQDDDAEQN